MRLLLLLDDDPVRRYDWQERAACRDYGTDLFFESDNERGELRSRREQAAKKVCAVCPVRTECLRFAESTPERFGVWGGTTQRERVTRRRHRPGTQPARRNRPDGRRPPSMG